MTCPNCEENVLENTDFCPNCGNMIQIPTDNEEQINQYDQYIEPNEFKQNNQKQEKPKKTLNIKALIKLIISVLIFIIIIATILVPIISLNNEKNQVKDFTGVRVYLPKESQKIKGKYLSLKEAVTVDVKETDASGLTDIEVIEDLTSTEELTCSAVSAKSINGIKWRYADCKRGKENIKIYTSMKSEKAYTIIVGYNKQDEKVSKKYIEKLEKYLEFK